MARMLIRQLAFLLEGQMLHSLNSDHLVRLLGMCTAAIPFQLVLEFVPHGDLRGYLRSDEGRALGPTAMARMGLQIARGMEFLVQHSVVHRDLAARCGCL